MSDSPERVLRSADVTRLDPSGAASRRDSGVLAATRTGRVAVNGWESMGDDGGGSERSVCLSLDQGRRVVDESRSSNGR